MTVKTEQINATSTASEYEPAHDGRGQTKAGGTGARILSAVQARQGVISGRVVTMLGLSTVLAVIGLVLAYVWN
jgi:hypothetical protein